MDEARTTPGQMLGGRYVLGDPIARGGAATVWRARDSIEDRTVAIKVLHREARDLQKVRERFAAEAALLSTIEHPHIARAYAFDLEGAVPFVAMELVEGEPLDAELGRRAELGRHFDHREVLEMLAQIASALEHAHALGVVHRDLKPSNVLLAGGGSAQPRRLKLVDFGVAKLVDRPEGEETTQGSVLGTLMYMPPEQARGAVIDHRADLYSLAVIAFELLTLRRAWARDGDGRALAAYAEPVRSNRFNAAASLAERIATEPRPKARAFRPELAEEVDRVLERALAIEPNARFDRAGAFVDALRAALAPVKKPPVITLAAGLLALLSIAAAIAVIDRRRAPPEQLPAPRVERPAAEPRAVATPVRPAKVEVDEPDPGEPPATRARPAPAIAPDAEVAAPVETEESPVAGLRQSYAELARAPSAAGLSALAEQIAGAAERIPDERTRARVSRLALSSAAVGDLEGVERALSALEAALRR